MDHAHADGVQDERDQGRQREHEGAGHALGRERQGIGHVFERIPDGCEHLNRLDGPCGTR